MRVLEVLAADDFERANANPAGAPWVTAGSFGALQIIDGAIAGVNSSNRGAYYGGITYPADQWAEAIYSALGTGEGGPAVRMGASGVNAYRVDFNGSTFRIAKHVANAYTGLFSASRTVAIGDVVRIEAEGTTIRGYHNGDLVGSVTDTSLSAGNAGLVIWSGARFASWRGGMLRDPPPRSSATTSERAHSSLRRAA